MSGAILDALRFARETFESHLHAWYQRRRLKKMLADKRFPKGFRSIEQLSKGIGADKKETERLLLQIGARKSEVSEELKMD